MECQRCILFPLLMFPIPGVLGIRLPIEQDDGFLRKAHVSLCDAHVFAHVFLRHAVVFLGHVRDQVPMSPFLWHLMMV